MKRFRSRLESLHRLRDQQEQLARAQVAECRQQHQRAEQQVGVLRKQLDAISSDTISLLALSPGAETLNGMRSLFRQHQVLLEEAVCSQQAAGESVESALLEWNAARGDVKAVASRIEQEKSEHRRSTLLHQEHQLMEVSSQDSFRRASENRGGTES